MYGGDYADTQAMVRRMRLMTGEDGVDLDTSCPASHPALARGTNHAT